MMVGGHRLARDHRVGPGRSYGHGHSVDVFHRRRHRIGFLTYVAVKILAGNFRDCSPAMIAVALLFAAKFALLD